MLITGLLPHYQEIKFIPLAQFWYQSFNLCSAPSPCKNLQIPNSRIHSCLPKMGLYPQITTSVAEPSYSRQPSLIDVAYNFWRPKVLGHVYINKPPNPSFISPSTNCLPLLVCVVSQNLCSNVEFGGREGACFGVCKIKWLYSCRHTYPSSCLRWELLVLFLSLLMLTEPCPVLSGNTTIVILKGFSLFKIPAEARAIPSHFKVIKEWVTGDFFRGKISPISAIP